MSQENDMNVVLNQLILKIIYKRSEEISYDFNLDKLRGIQFDAKSDTLKTIFDNFETALVLKAPGDSEVSIRLVESVVRRDPNANKPFADLETKLKHLQILNEEFQKTTSVT